MKKTGFSEKQIHNIVYKLKKQGKVKSEGKGVYVKAWSFAGMRYHKRIF